MKEQKEWKQSWILLCLCVLMFCTSGARADFTFSEPVNLGAPVNTSLDEGMSAISSDGLSLYFVLNDPNGYGGQDIMVAKRKSTKDAWEPPANLGPNVNSSAWDWWPCISADGLILYFSRMKPDWSDCDIWQTTRPTVNDDWESAVKLEGAINSLGGICPYISADGLEFYFVSDRQSLSPFLYVCRRESTQDAWSEPVARNVLNTNAGEYGPCLSADGLAMFFSSWRDGGYGNSDIYMTTRPTLDSEWLPPINIGSSVNSSFVEMATSISSDGRTLYFCENPYYDLRPWGMGGSDIWQVSIDPILDFNGDELIDCNDITIMVEYWGTDDSLCDIGPMPWGDGVVDAKDLLVLAESMIETTSSYEVPNFLVVDDFEEYSDNEPNRVYRVWSDGWENPETNGAVVGYTNPDLTAGEHVIEMGTSHSGFQCMPYFYDTDMKISETSRPLTGIERDWTRDDVNELRLWFKGYPTKVSSFTEEPSGQYRLVGTGSDIWGSADEFQFAYMEIDRSETTIIAKVEGLETADPCNAWVKAGIMIRDDLTAGAQNSAMLLTTGNGLRYQYRVTNGGYTDRIFEPNTVAPLWLKLNMTVGGLLRAYVSPDGSSWTNFGNVKVNAMTFPVYVGLAVTSHDADATAEGTFSNVTITGSGNNQDWKSQDVGIAMNTPESMYVTLNDIATEYYIETDPNFPTSPTVNTIWRPWCIELQKFADQGVDLTNVEKLTIGVGTRNDVTSPGGPGKIYIDDIRLY